MGPQLSAAPRFMRRSFSASTAIDVQQERLGVGANLGDDEGHPLRHQAGNEMHVAAQAGNPFMLCLRQFAFPHNTLMLFVCTLDAIFKLAPIVRELLGHYIGPARHIAIDCRPDVHGLPNPELMRGHRVPPIVGRPHRAFALTSRVPTYRKRPERRWTPALGACH